MARLALGVVGAVVGGFFGGPQGAQMGWMIGSMIGGVVDPQVISNQGPRLNDLRVQVSSWGVNIPVYYGTYRGAGNVIWSTPLQETATTTEEDGKGGPSVESTTYSYSVNLAVALCEGEIGGIRKIWADGRLIYNVGNDATAETLTQSNAFAAGFKVYPGSQTQLPDPTMEADKGVGGVSAYRGLAYVVFEGFQLGNYGNRIPNFEFEVVKSGSLSIKKAHFAEQTAATTIAWVSPEVCYWWSTAVPPVTVYRAFNGVPEQTSRVITFGSSFFNTRPAPVKSLRTPMIAAAAYGFDGLPCYVEYYNLDTGALAYRATLPMPGSSLVGPSGAEFIAAHDEVSGAYGYAVRAPSTHLYNKNIGISTGFSDSLIPIPVGRTLDDFALYQGKVYAITSSGSSENRAFYLDVYDQRSGLFVHEWEGPTDDVSTGGRNFLSICVNETGVYIWYASTGGRKIYRLTENGPVLLCPDANTIVSESGGLANYAATMFWTDGNQAIIPPAINGTAGKYYIDFIRFQNLVPSAIALSTIVADQCARSGLDSGDIDVTALTDTVSGYAVTRQGPARANVEQLRQAFYFDAVESDHKLKFVKRGGAVDATVAYDDLAAHEAGGNAPNPLDIRRTQEVELPQQVSIKFANVDGDYQIGTEKSSRLVTASKNQVSIDLAIAMTPDKAAQISDVLLFDAHATRTPIKFSTTKKYAKFQPADVLILQTPTASYRVRIAKKDEAGPLISWDGVTDDATIYTSSATGGTSGQTQTQITTPGPTNAQFLDIPLVRDEDDDAGFYVAMGGYKPAWHGAALFRSPDGVAFSNVASVMNAATIGTCDTTLGDWTGGNFFDETNALDVTLTSGSLSSQTIDQVLNGANAALVGNEIIQFKNAVLIGENKYRLSGLLRGRRGTEQHQGAHAAGEWFVLFTVAGIARPVETAASIGANRYYKPVSFGRTQTQTDAQQFTNAAIGLKPYAPVNLSGGKQPNGDFILAWHRRTRVDGGWRDYVDAALGEASQSYEVDIMSGTTIKRTLTSSTSTVTYTAAMGTADFGAPPANLTVKVYQVSATVGRGFAATKTY